MNRTITSSVQIACASRHYSSVLNCRADRSNCFSSLQVLPILENLFGLDERQLVEALKETIFIGLVC
jgi:hypothetical protein